MEVVRRDNRKALREEARRNRYKWTKNLAQPDSKCQFDVSTRRSQRVIVNSHAEYRTTPYKTMLQDHKPGTIQPNSSALPLKLFSSVRKPPAAFLRLATR